MADYTNYGHSTWRWETFVQMDYAERNLWNGLYTTGEAKRFPPGLWHGDQAAMARAAMMPIGDVFDTLDRMEAKQIVEIDRRHWVVRMTALPNAGERPASWKALLGFWNKFSLIPPCPVRDRYPLLMKWLVEQVPRGKGKGVSDDMLETWRETFGTIRVPAESSSSYLLCDSNTGTRHQPSLFQNISGNDRAAPRLLPSGTEKEISPVRPIPNRLGTGEEKEEGEVMEQEEEEEEEEESEAQHEVGRLALTLGGEVAPGITLDSAPAGHNARPHLQLLPGGGGSDIGPAARSAADPTGPASERSRALREEIARIAGAIPSAQFLIDTQRKPEPS